VEFDLVCCCRLRVVDLNPLRSMEVHIKVEVVLFVEGPDVRKNFPVLAKEMIDLAH